MDPQREVIMKKGFSGGILLCAILLACAGCMTVGHDFPVDPVSHIQIGKTTKGEVLSLFGQPWRTGIENGMKTWTYGLYRYCLFGESRTRDLVLRFDKDDMVASFSFNSNYPEDMSP
jgi:hypothetical protein